MSALVKFKCAYCGSDQSWSGTGTPVCSQCGASQPAGQPAAAATPPKRSLLPRVALAVIAAAAAFGVYYVLQHRHKPQAAQTMPPAATATITPAPAPVGASRIVRVDNPHIRIIPKDVEFTAQDLLDSVSRGPAPAFDPKFFVVKTPRRMKDEENNTVFLGEVTNTSSDQVAISPVAVLTLTKNGKLVDSAEHNFPDLTPGSHVPVFFHYDGEPKAFDAIRFDWKPTQSYKAADDQHPALVATVAAHEIKRGDTIVNFTQYYYYNYAHVTGSIANNGHKTAKNIALFVILRDAKGDITGYERQNIGTTIEPGASANFDTAVTQWGGPVATVEAVALPTTPPGL